MLLGLRDRLMRLWLEYLALLHGLNSESFQRNKLGLACSLYLRDRDAEFRSVQFNWIAGSAPDMPASHSLGGVQAYLALRGGASQDWIQARIVKFSDSSFCQLHRHREWCLLTSVSAAGSTTSLQKGDVVAWDGLSSVNVSYEQDASNNGWTQKVYYQDQESVLSQLTTSSDRATIMTIGVEYYGDYEHFPATYNFYNIRLAVSKANTSLGYLQNPGCKLTRPVLSQDGMTWSIGSFAYRN